MEGGVLEAPRHQEAGAETPMEPRAPRTHGPGPPSLDHIFRHIFWGGRESFNVDVGMCVIGIIGTITEGPEDTQPGTPFSIIKICL